MAKPVANFASTAGQILSVLPGRIGEFGRAFNKGVNVVKDLVNLLPNSNAKEKINNAINNGSDWVNDKFDRGRQITENVNNTVQPWIHSGTQIADRLRRYATDFTNY